MSLALGEGVSESGGELFWTTPSPNADSLAPARSALRAFGPVRWVEFLSPVDSFTPVHSALRAFDSSDESNSSRSFPNCSSPKRLKSPPEGKGGPSFLGSLRVILGRFWGLGVFGGYFFG